MIQCNINSLQEEDDDDDCNYSIESREVMVDVFQRLQYLETDFPIFNYLNCEINNLTELVLWDHGDPWSDQMDAIEYPNFKKIIH